jgi:hypothetical protein
MRVSELFAALWSLRRGHPGHHAGSGAKVFSARRPPAFSAAIGGSNARPRPRIRPR